MGSPPGICQRCGYVGPVPGFHATNATNITFVGSSGSCPRCGGRMNIIDGTYDVVGGVVRLVRDADLTADRIRDLRRQLSRDVSPQEFAAANPDVAPIVQAIVDAATASGRSAQWARDLLLILSIVLTLYFGTKQVDLAQEQVDISRQQLRQDEQNQTTTKGTQSLSDEDIERMVQAIREEMRSQNSLTSKAPGSAGRKAKAKPKKGKTHGRDKRRRR